jgi:hypothetical protein
VELKTTIMVLALGALGCGGYRAHEPPAPPSCDDLDGDGYGSGDLCLGSDCDDRNADVWTDDDCAEFCDANPLSAGCPCTAVEPEICYDGAPGTLGVGVCRAGIRMCSAGVWSACDGQVVPVEEACNEADDDCDGAVDEGVTNECGTCGGDCDQDCVGRGEGCAPWDPDDEGDGVGFTCGEDKWQCISLDGGSVAVGVAWLANTSQGTISKIGTDSREEEGRYYTSGLDPVSAGSPSRTSVDREGAVVVGNRAFGRQPSVTRILAEDCPDENGDGRIDTSSGMDDVLEWGDDECVVWNTDVGGVGGIVRALAVEDRIELDGLVQPYVWVGLYSERRYYELDRETGEPTGTEVDVSPCTPYMATFDGDRRVWSSCLSQNLASFDTRDPDDVTTLVQPGSNYGIAVDPTDGRIWTGGSCTIYDPDADEFTSIAGCSGTVPLPDGDGSVFMGACWGGGFGGGGTCRIHVDTLEVVPVDARSYGLGLTREGEVWAVSQSYATVDAITPNDFGDEEVETIALSLAGPYTYGDFTGMQHRALTGEIGEYSHVFEGCDYKWTSWDWLTWDAEVPDGASIEWSVRVADDLADLAGAPWTEIGVTGGIESPAILVVEDAAYLEVRARLVASASGDAPRLYTLGIEKSCPLGP